MNENGKQGGIKMKILLAGMNYLPNQFSRAIEEAGCEVVHTTGDPGAFPRFCDAAVIAKCQISHEKMWQVKDAYVQMGKPFFMAESFSPIKERFEEFVKLRREKMQAQTTVGKAFVEAGKKILVREEKTTEAGSTTKDRGQEMRGRLKPINPRIYEIVLQCTQAGMNAPDTIEMLTQEGFRRKDGETFRSSDVQNYRQYWKHKGILPGKQTIEPTTQTQTKQPRAYVKQKSSPLQLIDKILQAQIPETRKLALIADAREGKISQEEGVKCEIRRDGMVPQLAITIQSIYRQTESPVIVITKAQAIALMRANGAVRSFAEAD